MVADWQGSWEDSLFEGNTVLQEFAQVHARELEIVALEEIDGRIQSQIRVPQGGTVSVQLSLAQRSLRNWESHLTQLMQEAPETGHSLLARPDLSLHAFLSRLGWPLFPRGLRDVQLFAGPPSRQEPCPYCMGVLVEVGWMIEADPWVLLSLRGLSPETARRLLQGNAGHSSQIARQAGQIPLSGSSLVSVKGMARNGAFMTSEVPSESFWGNARALRAFRTRIFLDSASAPPKVTLGAPPVEDAHEKRSLAGLVAHLYDYDSGPPATD